MAVWRIEAPAECTYLVPWTVPATRAGHNIPGTVHSLSGAGSASGRGLKHLAPT